MTPDAGQNRPESFGRILELLCDVRCAQPVVEVLDNGVNGHPRENGVRNRLVNTI